MPTLTNPSGRIKIPTPLAGVSTRGAVTTDDKVLSLITPVASDGNSVLDHLSDIKAELGHRTDDDEFKGAYNSSTEYAIGDEVSWVDGTGKKRFYKRITTGNDGGTGNPSTNTSAWIVLGANIHDITTGDYALTTNSGLLEKLPNGTIRFNRRAITILQAALTEASAQTQIENTVKEVVQNNLWRGEWQQAAYASGAFVKDNGDYFRARQAIASTVNTAPASDTTNWTQLTEGGYHYDIAKRLEAITDLLAEQTFLVPSAANRGRWLSRRSDSEGYVYDNPPMQWMGNWSSGASYFFGDVVNHETRLWVLSAAATITTPKRGSSTEPGTDAAWTQIIVGHTSDVPGWRGAWVDLAGASIRTGDMVSHRGNYYIARNDQTTRSGTAPDQDETDWDLLDIVLGDYDDDEYYPEGGIVKYEGNWWYSTQYTVNTDSAPGTQGESKWLQLGGYATEGDLTQLRNDVNELVHSVRSSRGVLVDGLEEPPTATSESEVWLPRKAVRSYTASAALVSGSTDYNVNVGDEPGSYALRQSEVNKAAGVVGKFTTTDTRLWYGVFSRAGDGAPWPQNIGRFEQNPVGSAILGVGSEQISGNSWRTHLLIKQQVLVAIGSGTEPTSLFVQINDDSDVITSIELNTLGDVLHFHGVAYRHMTGTGTDRGAFGDEYETGSDDEDRYVEIALASTSTGPRMWLGGRQYHWVRKPPDTSNDDLPVYSEDFHTMKLISRANYTALESLPPRTAMFIFESA